MTLEETNSASRPFTPPFEAPPGRADLSQFETGDYSAGRGIVVRMLWYFVNALVLQSPLNPISRTKGMVLRWFGAKVGKNVYFKPGIRVKNPWMLSIGDNCWIGEDVWIDNLVPVSIGNNVCLSQGAYLCTGNHDWSVASMPYKLGEIRIEDGVWICTRALILSGVTIKSHAVVTAGAVLATDAQPYTIYTGNPAQPVKTRKLKSQ